MINENDVCMQKIIKKKNAIVIKYVFKSTVADCKRVTGTRKCCRKFAGNGF